MNKDRLEAFSLQLESEVEDITTHAELQERFLQMTEQTIGKTEQRGQDQHLGFTRQ